MLSLTKVQEKPLETRVLSFLCCDTLTCPPRSHGLSPDWRALINCIKKSCSQAQVCPQFRSHSPFSIPQWQIKASDFPKMNLYTSNVNAYTYERSPVTSASLVWGSHPVIRRSCWGRKKNKGEMSTAPGDSLGTVLGRAGRLKGEKDTHWWKLTAKYNYLKAVEYEELIHHRKPKVNPRVYNLSAGGAFTALNADLLPHTTKREDHYGLIW